LQNNVVLLATLTVSYIKNQLIDNKNSKLKICALFANMLLNCTTLVNF
jgi:hypothetical protein